MTQDNGEFGKVARQFHRQHVSPTLVRDERLVNHPCKQCGKLSGGDFCSEKCSVAYHEEKELEKENAKKEAEIQDAVLSWASGNRILNPGGPNDPKNLTKAEKEVSGIL